MAMLSFRPTASNSQPHCRCCGKAIRKTTVKHLFGRDPRFLSRYTWLVDHSEKPATVEEAQRLMNGRIIKHRRSHDRSYIAEVIEWDGETYDDHDFCSTTCAAVFGRMAAKTYPGLLSAAAGAAEKNRQTRTP